MKKLIYLPILLFAALGIAQENQATFKKRVLETTEVDFLTSYYTQDGNNASVTGGIGTEKLSDFTPTIVISMPLNADDVLTIDVGISAYTSASSSNLNPFDISGASRNGGGDDDDEDDDRNAAGNVVGSPWVASSGASRQDVWSNVNLDYSHSSDNRNTVWNADVSLATEYDYFSLGFGGGILKQFNEKNTTLGVNTKIYLDTWMPKYPTELDSYLEVNGNLNQGFFEGITILDQNGNASTGWNPISGFKLIDNKGRNSYSLSFSFSQILNKNAQVSLFFDVVQQKGWLSNPMQRVYFADVANYFIGNASSINNYTSPNNKDVFQLADDIERLPDTRFKMPFGLRFNYYFNEVVTMRTYYRYYFDDWGIKSHTASIELPIKISSKFTLYPTYRYYNQTAADYFAPFDENISTNQYYTSDYDLSKFNANQYGFGIGYTDIFTKSHIWKLGLKSIDLKYNNYKRNTGLNANIVSAGVKFVMDN
ncbi:DUF3570 domain-containing protein [Mariniflexile maritimum]|uniref:DUF3570 domain-containing protein n=1 Tax=Mariniflexile maritimum TaxID=2682493 RepID=UPI0012F67482|nr:DUF3570 domain-containing protein [Mariniflexile maritimum]